MKEFAVDAFESLRAIDLEANTLVGHAEAGLCGAVTHWRKQIKAGVCDGPTNWRTMKEEATWTWRLRTHLEERGYQYVKKDKEEEARKYGTKRIDAIIAIQPDEKLWLEIKIAWKHYRRSSGTFHDNSSTYSSYLMGKSKSRSHSLARDFDKLEKLRGEEGDQLGVLLIGFDSNQLTMLDDIDRLSNSERLSQRGWLQVGPSQWNDRRCVKTEITGRITCWFWWRSANLA